MNEIIGVELVCKDNMFTMNLKKADASLVSINKSFKNTVRHSQHTESGLARAARSFRHASTTVAALRYSLMDLGDVFITLPKAILDTTGKFERLHKLMEGLSKQTDPAARMKEAGDGVKYIIDMAKNAPFSIDALSDSFVKFKAGGVDPTNGSLKALSDSIARFGGDSASLKRASVAIQQMGGKGVISMEELRQQLGEAVPTAMQYMAQGTGVSMAKLSKQVSLGAVESTEALSRMFAVMKFYNDGAGKQMMEVWSGVTARLQTSWDLLINDVGKSEFAKEVKGQLQDLTQYLDGSEVKEFASELGSSLATVTRALVGTAKGIKENIELVKSLGLAFVALRTGTMVSNVGANVMSGLVGSPNAQARREAQEKAAIERLSFAETVRLKKEEALAIRQTNVVMAQDAQKKAAEELAITKAGHRAILNDRTALNVAIAKLDRERLATQTMMGAVGSAYKPNLIAQNQRMLGLEKDGRHVDRSIDAYSRLTKVQETHNAKQLLNVEGQKKLAYVSGITTARIVAQTAAMRVAGGVLNLMGGWVGAISTVLMLGVAAWWKWGNAGEKAIEAVKLAINSGTANSQTVKAIDGEISGLEEERNGLIAQQNALRADLAYRTAINKGGSQANVAREEDANLQRKINELDVKVANFALMREQSRDQAITTDGTDALAALERTVSNSLAPVTRESQEAIKRIDDGWEAVKKENLSRVELEKRSTEFQLKRNQVMYDSEVQQKAVIDNHLRVAKQTLDNSRKAGASVEEINKQTAVYDNLMARSIQAATDVRNAESTLTVQDMSGGKADKPTKAQKKSERNAATRLEILDRAKELREQFDDASSSMLANLVDPKSANLAGTQFATLNKQVLKLAQSFQDAGGNADVFKESQKDLVSRAALADLADMALEMRESTRQIGLDLMTTDSARLQAEYDYEMQFMDDKYKSLMEKASGSAQEIKAIEDDKAKYILARNEKLAHDMRTPLQKMTDEWRDGFAVGVDNLVANWADDSIDAIVEFCNTGKLEWRSMLASWLTDFNRLQLQKAMAGTMEGAFSSAGEWIKKGLDFLSGAAAPTAPVAGGDVSTLLTQGVNGAVVALDSLKLGTEDLANTGIADMAKSLFQSALQSGVKLTAEQSATLAMANLAATAQLAAQALLNLAASQGAAQTAGMITSIIGMGMGAMGGGLDAMSGPGGGLGGTVGAGQPVMTSTNVSHTFAKGGVMSQFGSIPLRKYAQGGIARSPQLALFGEGSHNEAYVPLPDGRSIPVTMAGGGGETSITPVNIEINITNSGEGSSKEDSTGGEGAWKEVASKVKGIVLTEIANQQRAGGMLR